VAGQTLLRCEVADQMAVGDSGDHCASGCGSAADFHHLMMRRRVVVAAGCACSSVWTTDLSAAAVLTCVELGRSVDSVSLVGSASTVAFEKTSERMMLVRTAWH
jgi:hypothetical protein